MGYSNPNEAEPGPHRDKDNVANCCATGAGEAEDSHVWWSVYLLVKLQVGVSIPLKITLVSIYWTRKNINWAIALSPLKHTIAY